MSNLITQMNASAAASAARRAEEEAREARNAAEERLESGKNPFIVFFDLSLEKIPQPGFFSSAKRKLSTKGRKLSVKKSDIAYLSEATDDFGTAYTVVHLESRCDLVEMDDVTALYVAGTVEENEAYINSK